MYVIKAVMHLEKTAASKMRYSKYRTSEDKRNCQKQESVFNNIAEAKRSENHKAGDKKLHRQGCTKGESGEENGKSI